MKSVKLSTGATVTLVSTNSVEPRRLPLLAVKVSTGKAYEKGIEYYLKVPWKESWSDWLRQAKTMFPSVLEHSVFTFYIDGCSRVCSHQLVRHRLVSFTQESQRYTEVRILKAVNARDLNEAFIKWGQVLTTIDVETTRRLFVFPPNINEEELARVYASATVEYTMCRLNGKTMEDCRYVLPQAIRTSLLMTANLRELLHIIELRTSSKAQWEIREVANAFKRLIMEHFKELFQ